MTAKEYLTQAIRLDLGIETKIRQIEILNDLATSCTSVVGDTPRCSSDVVSRTEEAIINVIDLKNEVKSDVNDLVGLKREIMNVIKQSTDVEHRLLLEKRYLCFSTWEQIAVDLGYSIQHTYRIHGLALKEISEILKHESKCY